MTGESLRHRLSPGQSILGTMVGRAEPLSARRTVRALPTPHPRPRRPTLLPPTLLRYLTGLLAADHLAAVEAVLAEHPESVENAQRGERPDSDAGWRAAAACGGLDTATSDRFIDAASQLEAVDLVRHYCHACPVTANCLREGLRVTGQGLWGGVVLSPTHKVKSTLAPIDRRPTSRPGAPNPDGSLALPATGALGKRPGEQHPQLAAGSVAAAPAAGPVTDKAEHVTAVPQSSSTGPALRADSSRQRWQPRRTTRARRQARREGAHHR